MKVPSPRKTASGCTHHASRRIVSPKDRRLRTSKAMLDYPLLSWRVLKPKRRGGVKRRVGYAVFCRGGPMWPPWVGEIPTEPAPAQGGHIGPPLQRVRHFWADGVLPFGLSRFPGPGLEVQSLLP